MDNCQKKESTGVGYRVVILLLNLSRLKKKIVNHIKAWYYGKLFHCPGKKYPSIAPGVAFSCPQNIRTGRNLVINPQCYLAAKGHIVIGDDVALSAGAKIISSGLTVKDGKVCRKHIHKQVTIGNNVWIGSGATILPGVTINDNVIIAAGAIVTKDCESGWIYAGIPAKKLREL